MLQPGQGYADSWGGRSRNVNGGALPFWKWAADNGRFATPATWEAGDWIAWLASIRQHRARCLFVVAPDDVGNAQTTLELSRPYLPTIRQLGYKAAFVSQDGCTSDLVPWDGMDALFVGGSTEWKLSEPSYALVKEARERGKWTHMGRVNSLQRLRACAVSLFDSADGTYVRFGPDRNLARVHDWLDTINSGQMLLEHTA